MHLPGSAAWPELLLKAAHGSPLPHQPSRPLLGVSCFPFPRGQSLAPLCPGIAEGRRELEESRTLGSCPPPSMGHWEVLEICPLSGLLLKSLPAVLSSGFPGPF